MSGQGKGTKHFFLVKPQPKCCNKGGGCGFSKHIANINTFENGIPQNE